jgi:hypothetical protein
MGMTGREGTADVVVLCWQSTPCLACEIQDFFLAMHCRTPPSTGKGAPAAAATALQSPYEPLVPHRLLHAMWSHASGEHLAGYEQQVRTVPRRRLHTSLAA